MPIEILDFAEPFFTVKRIANTDSYRIQERTILLNLSEKPIGIQEQQLGHLQSVIVAHTHVTDLTEAIAVEGFAEHADEEALMAEIKQSWPSAFDVRKEERLRGISHYMSPKIWLDNRLGLTMYHSGSVPLNVGLHRDHAFCPVPGFREVHTQIVGFGKMQQCRERDISTLYLEELMAPGTTHRPMYDAEGNYPWHQFETITPSVFMAVEMLPDGALPPA